MKDYQDCKTTESQDLWEKFEQILINAIKNELLVDVELRLFTWKVGSIVIEVGVRKRNGHWTDGELTALTERLLGTCVGHPVNEHLFVESLSPIAHGHIKIFSYQFQILCSETVAGRVSNIWKKMVNISADDVFMELLGEKIYCYFYDISTRTRILAKASCS